MHYQDIPISQVIESGLQLWTVHVFMRNVEPLVGMLSLSRQGAGGCGCGCQSGFQPGHAAVHRQGTEIPHGTQKHAKGWLGLLYGTYSIY
jgi:hypothetical protein